MEVKRPGVEPTMSPAVPNHGTFYNALDEAVSMRSGGSNRTVSISWDTKVWVFVWSLAAQGIFIWGCSPGAWGTLLGHSPGMLPREGVWGLHPVEVEAVCRYCLQITTAEMIKIW